mmetsp:Transcript_59451/g.140081  ORF Transcript_59451/g.140081 Transcript_59451/m.140081 type:complete len:230 (+) Transcript_59451:650-1339(+)
MVVEEAARPMRRFRGHNVVRSVTIVSYAASGEVYAVAGYSASASWSKRTSPLDAVQNDPNDCNRSVTAASYSAGVLTKRGSASLSSAITVTMKGTCAMTLGSAKASQEERGTMEPSTMTNPSRCLPATGRSKGVTSGVAASQYGGECIGLYRSRSAADRARRHAASVAASAFWQLESRRRGRLCCSAVRRRVSKRACGESSSTRASSASSPSLANGETESASTLVAPEP